MTDGPGVVATLKSSVLEPSHTSQPAGQESGELFLWDGTAFPALCHPADLQASPPAGGLGAAGALRRKSPLPVHSDQGS